MHFRFYLRLTKIRLSWYCLAIFFEFSAKFTANFRPSLPKDSSALQASGVNKLCKNE